MPTPRDDYLATLDAIASVVAALERQAGATATVGVGIPGALSPDTALVKNANSTWLIGRPLLADLEARLDRPVRIANDANCFAVSEAADGAAAGAAVVFGVIVGTGTGAGIVVHGRQLTGPNAIAGEWGHNPLPWPGPDEWPGPGVLLRQDTAASRPSSPDLASPRDYEARTGRPRTRRPRSSFAPQRVMRMRRLQSSDTRIDWRAPLPTVINVLDPDVIVIGGRDVEHRPSLSERAAAVGWLRIRCHATGRPPSVRASRDDDHRRSTRSCRRLRRSRPRITQR